MMTNKEEEMLMTQADYELWRLEDEYDRAIAAFNAMDEWSDEWIAQTEEINSIAAEIAMLKHQGW